MSVTDKQQQYLQAMGIDTWLLRAAPQPQAVPDKSHDSVPVIPPDNVVDVPMVPEGQGDLPQYLSQEETAPAPQGQVLTEIPSDTGSIIGTYNWNQLQAAVKNCVACDLHGTRKNTVFGVGDPKADWMVIGEAPGAEEDQQGEPFVGRAGQLLNKMLQAIGLSRQQVFIANILKCRPPNNRDPRPEEVVQCEAYLRRQVELVKPKIILAVGRIAAHNLLKTDSSLAQLRGKCFYYSHSNVSSDGYVDNTSDASGSSTGSSGEGKTPVIVTYHPAYLLRSPGEKRKAWQDLLFAQTIIQQEDR